MKLSKYILLSIVTLLLFSCTRENYLDEVIPKGITIPSTIADYRLLLDSVTPDDFSESTPISSGFDEKHGISSFLIDDHIVPDDLSQFISLPERRAYLFEDLIYVGQEQDPNWDFYYNQIFTSNIILNGLQTVTDGTPEQIAELAAEAKLHRAYAYFNLVNLYGLHYNPTTANTDLGVPLRLGIALEDLDFTRASVQVIYDLVIDDITTSIDALQDTQDLNQTFRPSKAAAYGLLSKVYLYQSEYELALDAVDNALNLNSVLRNINNDNLSSFVFSINHPEVTADPQVVWYKQNNQNIFVSDQLRFSYSNVDRRLLWFTEDSSVSGSDSPFYYPRQENRNFSDGINTPELYLIRAECNTRLMNLGLANNDLNELREKRIISGFFAPINITDQDDLLAFVKQERRFELIGNYDRLFDIKRYNLFDNDNISITHILDNQSVTLEANSLNWALPIAQIYIQQNPEIQQNPRN